MFYLNEGLALDLALLAVDGPPLEPWHFVGWLQHVVAVPAGDRHERDRSRVVTCPIITIQSFKYVKHWKFDFVISIPSTAITYVRVRYYWKQAWKIPAGHLKISVSLFTR